MNIGDDEKHLSGLEALPPYPAGDSHLSFFERHFCRPVEHAPEKASDPRNRSFSVRAKGSLIAGILILLPLLAIIIAPAVAVSTRNKTASTGAQLADVTDGTTFTGEDTSAHEQPGIGLAQGGVLASSNVTVNLALNQNFADPDVIQFGNVWYAFSTGNALTLRGGTGLTAPNVTRGNVQVATSTDFVHWTLQPVAQDPLPAVGAWSLSGFHKNVPYVPRAAQWAPTVFRRVSDGKWIMYYSANTNERSYTHCLGAATSDTFLPTGPFTPLQNSFACQIAAGGNIDPVSYIENRTTYIIYKVDGNNRGNGGSCGNTVAPIKSTPIMLQQVQTDGLTKVGNSTQILDRTDADGPLVEAPVLVKVNGTYFLFFSSGCTGDSSYTVKYATSKNVTGPYIRNTNNTLLKTGDAGLLAPGSASVVEGSDGKWRMAFHARVKAPGGTIRAMFTVGVAFNSSAQTVSLVNL